MLEVVHLTKIYKAKGGVETKALNDAFPKKAWYFCWAKAAAANPRF